MAANYADNQLIIDRDIGYIPTQFNTGVFFNAGFFSGEAQGLYMGYPTWSEELE